MPDNEAPQVQGVVLFTSVDRLVVLRNALNTLINLGVPVGKEGFLQWGDVRFLFKNDRAEAVEVWAFAKMAAAGLEGAAYAGGDDPPTDPPGDPAP